MLAFVERVHKAFLTEPELTEAGADSPAEVQFLVHMNAFLAGTQDGPASLQAIEQGLSEVMQ